MLRKLPLAAAAFWLGSTPVAAQETMCTVSAEPQLDIALKQVARNCKTDELLAFYVKGNYEVPNHMMRSMAAVLCRFDRQIVISDAVLACAYGGIKKVSR